MKKIIAVFVLLMVLVISGFALYQYNKPHKNLKLVGPEYVLSSFDLYSEYIQNEDLANSKYLDKIIEVRGRIKEIQIDDYQISLLLVSSNDGLGYVTCSMNVDEKSKIISLKSGDYALIKGVCTGYLMDVVLNKCIIINQ